MIFAKLKAFFEWMGQKALAKSRRSLDYKWTTYRSETPREEASQEPGGAARAAAKATGTPQSRAPQPVDVPEQELTPSIQIDVDELFENEKKPAAKKTTRKVSSTAKETSATEKKTVAKRTTTRRTGAKTPKAKENAAQATAAESEPSQAELPLPDVPQPAAVKKSTRRASSKKSAETEVKRPVGRPRVVKPVTEKRPVGRPRLVKSDADKKPSEPKKRGRRPKPPGLSEEQLLECQQMFEGRTGAGLVELLVVDFPELAGIRNKRQLMTHLRASEPMFRKLKKALSHSYHRAHREKLAEKALAEKKEKQAEQSAVQEPQA